MGPPPVATAHIPTSVTTGVNVNASSHASAGAANANVKASASTRTGVTTPGSADFIAAAKAKGDASLANGAALLGKLNAAHASDKAFEHASAKSVVGMLATYKSATLAANADISNYTQLISQTQAKITTDTQAVTDAQAALTAAQALNPADPAKVTAAQDALTAAQNALTADQTLLAQQQASLAAAQQAQADALSTLATSTNRTISADAAAKLNALLGI
jgi:hypothetical protein